MSDLLKEIREQIGVITFNRIQKQNAFDDMFLQQLQHLLVEAIEDPFIRVILLKANGSHFSAGADIAWMQRMVQFDEATNLHDAMILAQVMHTLYTCPKPTIAMVHGATYGGGIGLVAACDIAIAANDARFCFSEVRLGLIPAVISPYIVKAMGERAAKALFMSAEVFSAEKACTLGLIHACHPLIELESATFNYAGNMAALSPQTLQDCKGLINEVAGKEINHELLAFTAQLIAKKRVSNDAQKGLRAFLNKETPKWDDDANV